MDVAELILRIVIILATLYLVVWGTLAFFVGRRVTKFWDDQDDFFGRGRH